MIRNSGLKETRQRVWHTAPAAAGPSRPEQGLALPQRGCLSSASSKKPPSCPARPASHPPTGAGASWQHGAGHRNTSNWISLSRVREGPAAAGRTRPHARRQGPPVRLRAALQLCRRRAVPGPPRAIAGRSPPRPAPRSAHASPGSGRACPEKEAGTARPCQEARGSLCRPQTGNTGSRGEQCPPERPGSEPPGPRADPHGENDGTWRHEQHWDAKGK